jgi:NADH-quinone oxidoreductase subunit G
MSERPRNIEITTPVTITVDGREITAQDGELLIDACERNGTYIPRFCYHPRMEPVGMCRMCLVEVDSGRGPALQPSCMIPVTGEMTVDTTNERVAKVQDGVIEFLLANHPLDCPVCDAGGECPLQDQTMAYGPGESRWVEEKRHYEKPIAISETVYLDRERCILCDRCTRFAKDVAGDPLIHFINRGSTTEVNTFPDEPFASYFSGNTVQICPVGALTAKPYRFKARPWDLEEVESTCTDCAYGCRISVQSSQDELVRYQGVDSDPVNWSWLCDRGRFGYESAGSDERLQAPLVRADGELRESTWAEAMALTVQALRGADPAAVAVLGGARLTNESAYAWAKLAKAVIGTDHVDAQLGDGLPADVVLGMPGASIDEVCAPGTTVLYMGPDPKEELPVLHLRLKHAVHNDGVRIIEVSPIATSLSSLAAISLQYRPGEAAAVVASLLSGEVPGGGTAGVAEADLRAASELLRSAGDNLRVVVGRQNLAESPGPVVDAASAVRDAVPGARFLFALRRGNVRGALEAGLAPGMLPGGRTLDEGRDDWTAVWGAVPASDGLDAAGILSAAADGRIDVLFLLGADPLADFPDRDLAQRGLQGARTVVALDRFLTESLAAAADVVMAVAGQGEVEGTHTSFEGRVTVLNRKVTAPGTSRSDWMVAAELAQRLGADLGVVASAGELWDELVSASPVHGPVTGAMLVDPANADGVLLDLDRSSYTARPSTPVPATDAYSLRLVVDRVLYDRGAMLARAGHAQPLVGESTLLLGPADATRLGIDGGRVAVSSAKGSISVPVAVSAAVPRGSALIRHNLWGAQPTELIGNGDTVCEIRVEVAR